jgi:integrase
VSASTQNQALSALLFMYRHVLEMDVGKIEQVARARVPTRVPVVLSRDEVAAVMKHLTGRVWIIVVLLYGAGLRIDECLELRVKDIDFDRVVLPFALDRKYPNAATDWAWQFVFPASRMCRDARWGPPSRYHLHETVVQKARDVSTTMVYLHVLNRGALGVRSPMDRP